VRPCQENFAISGLKKTWYAWTRAAWTGICTDDKPGPRSVKKYLFPLPGKIFRENVVVGYANWKIQKTLRRFINFLSSFSSFRYAFVE
jgi:hypothetical protein